MYPKKHYDGLYKPISWPIYTKGHNTQQSSTRSSDELGSTPTQINKQAVTETPWDLGQTTHMLQDC